MTDEEQEPHEIKVEHEITHDVGVFPLVVFIFICAWIGSFDTEIRCALGSGKACAALKAEPPKAGGNG